MKKLPIDKVTFMVIPSHSMISAHESLNECSTLEEINKILEDSECDVWSWCDVEVRAEFKGLTGSDYLCACSYRDVDDFKNNSGYYEDMKQCAFRALESQVIAIVIALEA